MRHWWKEWRACWGCNQATIFSGVGQGNQQPDLCAAVGYVIGGYWKRIADLLSEHADSGEHILIVSHGGAIVDSLRNHVWWRTLESLKRTYDEGTDFLMLNCAITQVILESPPQLKLLHATQIISSKSVSNRAAKLSGRLLFQPAPLN